MDASALIRQLRAPGGAADPYSLYAAMAREHGPVVSHGRYTLVLSYAAADEVLRHPSRFRVAAQSGFAEAVGLHGPARPGASLLRTDGDEHDRMRAVLNRSFTPRHPKVAQLVERCVAESAAPLLARAGEVEFMDEVGYLLPISVICELLGIPRAARTQVRELAHRRTAFLEPEPEPRQIADAVEAGTEITKLLADLVACRRLAPRDDVISELVAHTGVADGLSEAELLANLSLLLVAGFETTANLLGNAVNLLVEHPESAERLRAEPELAAQFVGEAARYDPAVQIVARTAVEAGARIGAHQVPPGNLVMVMIGAAQRDPRRFADPDLFAPFAARTGGNLAFGAGPHYCLGAGLARLEAEALVQAISRDDTRVAAAGPGTRSARRLAIRGYDTLPLTVR